MKKMIFYSADNWTGFIIRLTIAIVLFPHGAQKLLGAFGGFGFNNTMIFFTQQVHLPWIIGFIIILIEFFAPLALIAGFAVRLWSVAIVFLFTGIIITTHLANGFFMNWFGLQKGEGFEFDLLMIGLSIALLINGAGRCALDRLMQHQDNAVS